MQHGFLKTAAASPALRVADCAYNTEQIVSLMQEADEKGVRLLVFPELCITGYTCADLFYQPTLLAGALESLKKIAEASKAMDLLCVVGLPLVREGLIYNCAAFVKSGEILGFVPKTNVSAYGERAFAAAPAENDVVVIGDEVYPFGAKLLFSCDTMPQLVIGAEIGEDYGVPCAPSVGLALAGASVIVNPAASPVLVTGREYRHTQLKAQSGRLVCGYVCSNAGEGESTTDVVYDAHSLIAENGEVLAERESFGSGLLITELDLQLLESERRKVYSAPCKVGYDVIRFVLAPKETALTRPVSTMPFIPEDEKEWEYRCRQILSIQCHGLKKRMEHSYSKTMVLGISGGLDSCLALLVCAGAMDLMGKPHSDIISVTMPCFGTTSRTKSNAERMTEQLGATLRVIDIANAVKVHFEDIGHSEDNFNVVFENAQARERTQVLMDIANQCGGMVIGTGDLSELALGWATYNGDHMSMYSVNGSIPKTLVRHVVRYAADHCGDAELSKVLYDILNTPVSPELLPPKDGEISQKTESLVGPYELHDFFLYYAVRRAFSPKKVYRLARYAFDSEYTDEILLYWLKNFYRRFFIQQFKRSCLPDGPKVGNLSFSPRGDWRMPSDACYALWMSELETL